MIMDAELYVSTTVLDLLSIQDFNFKCREMFDTEASVSSFDFYANVYWSCCCCCLLVLLFQITSNIPCQFFETCRFFLKISIFVLLGEWMNSSAGMAFAPHVITIGAGEVVKLFLYVNAFNWVILYRKFACSNMEKLAIQRCDMLLADL